MMGPQGPASAYDIRYATSDITGENWSATDAVETPPSPGIAGSEEEFTVTGLSSSTLYYFALKAVDDDSNWSGMSNVDSDTTSDALPEPDRFELRTSPGNLLWNLLLAYERGDAGQFGDLMDLDYLFVFSQEDQGQPETPEGFDKTEEIGIHTNMFGDLVDNLELSFDYDIGELVYDAEMSPSAADSVYRLDITNVELTLKGRLPGQPDMAPKTWLLTNGTQIFWFHKAGPDGELGAIEPTTGEPYWTIMQWEETTISGIKIPSDDDSWGSIKSMFR